MDRVKKASFFFLAGFLFVAGMERLTGAFIAILFSVLVLERLKLTFRRTNVSIFLYVFILLGLLYAVFYAARESVESLPEVANRSIPVVIEWAARQGLELPFNDLEGFKAEVVRGLRSQLKVLASSAEFATRSFVVLILAAVIAVSIFINPRLDLMDRYELSNNLYSKFCAEIAQRFLTFYHSFRTVMGAQLVISGINTVFTAIFILSINLPHRFLVIVATFLCGLLPVIGNIISNTIIFGIALTISVWKAVGALIFLIVLHKLEYFLNSKIIGGRIKNPMWLTLSSLIIGEYLLGIAGMILAPVVLHYVKTEMSRIEA